MATLFDVINLGQSVWIDTLSRSMLKTGQLQVYCEMGARGVTANPTILDKALSGCDDYDADIVTLRLQDNLSTTSTTR